ncbi:MAG: hypothetical protein RIA65_06745, partial [Woeseia sp.]
FSGWSVGPSIQWRPRSSLTVTSNLAYTHQGLDESQPAIEDFDGLTGFVAANLTMSNSVGLRVRAFRDISDLGGEIPLFTERTGITFEPRWQMTTKLSSRAQFAFQRRDFNATSLVGASREDDYSLAELWLDFSVAPRWLLSFGVGTEQRESSIDIYDFDDLLVHFTVRLDL